MPCQASLCLWFSSPLNLSCQCHVRPPLLWFPFNSKLSQCHVRPPLSLWFGSLLNLSCQYSFVPLVQLPFNSKLCQCHASNTISNDLVPRNYVHGTLKEIRPIGQSEIQSKIMQSSSITEDSATFVSA